MSERKSFDTKAFLRRQLPFIVFLVFAFAFRWSLADQYFVPSGSMLPTVEIGDRILVNKMAYDLKLPYTSVHLARMSDPQRGDIIVFENPTNGLTMVKRLIGLPGDQVRIRDGFVEINGEPIKGTSDGAQQFAQATATAADSKFVYTETFGEKHATIQRVPSLTNPQVFEFNVPAESYFAMGDNRDNSNDSRYWGFIPRDHLKGRAFAVFWSLTFENYLPHMNLARTGQALN